MNFPKISIRTKFLLVAFFTILFWLLLSIFYINTINRLKEEEQMISRITESIDSNSIQLLAALGLGLTLIVLMLFLLGNQIYKGSNKLLHFVRRLSRGQIPEKTEFSTADELSEIANQLNNFTIDLKNKIAYLQSIGEGNLDAEYQPDEADKLGNALIILAHHLKTKEFEERSRKKEDERYNWHSEGIAQLGEILRSERENVVELSFRIIQKLSTYMKIEMGTIFITNNSDPTRPRLESIAAYAYNRRKYLQKELMWGEGLPGTCAREKERIFITDMPEDYFKITSGIGDALPKSLLLVPLKIGDEVFGIIELASLRVMDNYEIEFVESLAESIASTLRAVKTNEKTAELLKQSQNQANELSHKEEQMRLSLKELEFAQEESTKKESEIAGILNAMNHSSLVAEFGINGRISSVNDKFVLLLESSRDHIIGKHHSEFAQTDKYSDDYKQFWASLREGESISVEEMYKLYSGKEIWLQQTFTPIFNNERKVYKILNIASDITQNREQQKSLEIHASELKRSSLEMETLNQAVNESIVKCEMDAEGIITDLNQNFSDSSGYSRKEVLGRNYRLFLKDIEKEQFEMIWSEVRKEKTYKGVMRRTKPTGEEVWLMSTLSPAKDESGEIYKIYFLALDITEKKLKYQLLEDANNEIERIRKQLKGYEDA